MFGWIDTMKKDNAGRNGRKYGVLLFLLALLLTGGRAAVSEAASYGTYAQLRSGNRAAAVTIVFSKPTAQVPVGGAVKLNPTVSGANTAVSWKSLNAGVATVSSNGIVVGKKAGSAAIIASVGV